jgi:hypothetical protein
MHISSRLFPVPGLMLCPGGFYFFNILQLINNVLLFFFNIVIVLQAYIF